MGQRGRRRSVVDFGSAQAGDVTTGDSAGETLTKTTIHGADPGRLVEMMELIIKNAWDDQQQREIRQTQHDRERREERDRADYHREMTRGRLEKIADDIAETQRLGRSSRRWLIGLTVAVVVIGAVLIVVVVDRVVAAAGMAVAVALASWLARGR